MKTTDRLSLPLLVAGIYAFAIGLVQMVPPFAEAVFSRPVVDPVIESLYGTALLTVGLLLLVLSGEESRPASMIWVVIGGLLLSAADFVAYWGFGNYDVSTALFPVVANLSLALWLGYALRRGDDGARVVGSG